MTVFLSGWVTAVFNPALSLTMGWLSVAAGVILVLLMIIWNRKIEVAARKAFGPYKEEEEVAA